MHLQKKKKLPALLGKYHYLLFALAGSIHPRMLLTVDGDMNPLPVPVRVGQAVDTVGQAGRPKTITGFQTYTTPVLLGYNERAELATDECKRKKNIKFFMKIIQHPRFIIDTNIGRCSYIGS
jgi:26S proteasome regulatory subunit N1